MIPNYERPAFSPVPKNAKGTVQVERITKSLTREKKEDAAKVSARKRDSNHCRWAHETAEERQVCARRPKHTAHWKGKGMGGNKDGTRNVRKNLITLCVDKHEGGVSLHSGKARLVPLTKDLMDGIVASQVKRGGKWVEIGREISIGIFDRRNDVRTRHVSKDGTERAKARGAKQRQRGAATAEAPVEHVQ